MLTKDELEVFIAEERPVGDFLFDVQKQCFTTDVEVIYEIREVDDHTFRTGEFIYFGGYEYVVEDEEKKTCFGVLEEVEEQLAKEYIDENHFMGFPVIYTNFRVELVENRYAAESEF